MNDLRSRIAAIVERDRARQLGEAGGESRGGVGTETLSTRETPSLRDGDPSRAGALGQAACVQDAVTDRPAPRLAMGGF
jgi:hypothetical protein